MVRLFKIRLPNTALVPLQAGDPDALHVVVLLLFQFRVLLPPDATVVGLAVKINVGAAAPVVTVMSTERLTPLHVSV